MSATSRRRQNSISRIVSEPTSVASQTQTQTLTHTQAPATSRRRQLLNSRIVSVPISVACQTQTQTHTHTHKHCLLSRACTDESTSAFLHDSHLSAKTTSDFSYSFRACQGCLTNANTNTHTHTHKHQSPLGEGKFWFLVSFQSLPVLPHKRKH